MTPVVACIVCARPLESLLTGGLQAGVSALALVVLLVLAALARGAVRIWRADRGILSNEVRER